MCFGLGLQKMNCFKGCKRAHGVFRTQDKEKAKGHHSVVESTEDGEDILDAASASIAVEGSPEHLVVMVNGLVGRLIVILSPSSSLLVTLSRFCLLLLVDST